MKEISHYHVFSDGWDEYPDTLRQAISHVNIMLEKGCENIRLYEVIEEDEEMVDENCLLSIGEFPH